MAIVLPISCPQGQIVEFVNFRFTPCLQLGDAWDVLEQCELTESCGFNNSMLENSNCREYVAKFPDQIFACKESEETQTISSPASFEPCRESEIEDLEDWLLTKSKSGRKKPNTFRRPTFQQRKDVARLGLEISEENWSNVNFYAQRLNLDTCIVAEKHLLILTPNSPREQHNDVIILVRLREADPIPIGLLAAHANEDTDTGQQAINVFLRSNATVAIVSAYFRESSPLNEICRANRRAISDNSHSMENLFFHAMRGIADGFTTLAFLEFHRCSGCGTMLIQHGVDGTASRPNSFIRSFVKVANDFIARDASTRALQEGFFAFLPQQVVRNLDVEIFQSSVSINGWGNAFSRTNINARYLQNLQRLCGGDFLGQSDENDTSRYLHIEQGAFSILYHRGWVRAIEALRNDTNFMRNRVAWKNVAQMTTAPTTMESIVLPIRTSSPSLMGTESPNPNNDTNVDEIVVAVMDVVVVEIVAIIIIVCFVLSVFIFYKSYINTKK